MNLNTEDLTINPCAVCSYPFADKHHIWPQAKGGKGLTTIALCPNHHRFANIVQVLVLQDMDKADIHIFADRYFDPQFNTTVLAYLIEEQQVLATALASFHDYSRSLELYADILEIGVFFGRMDVLPPKPERDPLVTLIEQRVAAERERTGTRETVSPRDSEPI